MVKLKLISVSFETLGAAFHYQKEKYPLIYNNTIASKHKTRHHGPVLELTEKKMAKHAGKIAEML